MSKGWSIFFGVLGYVVVQLTVSLILRQKMKGIQNNLQAVMQGTQKNIERKQQMFIHQRNMNLTMQRMQMEAEQKKGLEAALAVCDQYKPLFRWSPFVKKQVITMVTMLLNLPKPPKPDDTADALAIAICHAQCRGSAMGKFYNQR